MTVCTAPLAAAGVQMCCFFQSFSGYGAKWGGSAPLLSQKGSRAGNPTPAPSLCLIILGWSQRGPPSHTLLSSPDPQIKETFGRYGEVAPSPGPSSSMVTPSGTVSLVTMPQHPRIFPKLFSNCPLTLQSQGKGLGGHFWVAGMGGWHPGTSAEHRPPGAQKLAKR